MLDSLGAKTTKNYLVVFENNAVLTAPGGLPLTAAIVSFDKGKIGFRLTATSASMHSMATSSSRSPQ